MGAPVTYAAAVQYDGTDFAGFQFQIGKPTIQGALEAALESVTQETVRVTGAGRTDSGVHARAQVVSFASGWSRGLDELHRAWNARLPGAIAVQAVRPAPEGFHARRSAQSRTYRYTIVNRARRAPLLERYAWRVAHALDAAAMHAALQGYLGAHDFTAFGSPPRRGGNAARTMHAARCWREVDSVIVELTANAFLQGMVRRIVGALAALGEGQIPPDAFAELLVARDKSRVKWAAPPQGLCLWYVRYAQELFG